MWWGGSSQIGWGIAISQQYGKLFSVWYTYGQDGKVTWFVMPGGQWTTDKIYTGPLYRTTGSAWVGAEYDPRALKVIEVGSMTIVFTTPTSGYFRYTVDGTTRDYNGITRQGF
jgi:hypothetical protein